VLGVFCSYKNFRFFYLPISVCSFCITSSTVPKGNLQTNSACLIFQSRLFTWSDKIAPLIFNPSGINTSNGYPLIWLVIGQRIANPTLLLYDSGDKTNAGRRPVCSCPACGLKVIQTTSPRFGIYAIISPNFVSECFASINFAMKVIAGYV